MVGARLVCSAGARSFGAGASAGRGGGNGGDAAVGALEACSGKASSAVIMKKARMRMRACGSWAYQWFFLFICVARSA